MDVHIKSPMTNWCEFLGNKTIVISTTKFVFLKGEGELSVWDKRTLIRLEDIELLPDEDRKHIFYSSTILLKTAKLKAIR